MYVANYLMQTENKHHIVFRLTVLSHCFHSKHTITLTEYSKYTRNENNVMFTFSLYCCIHITCIDIYCLNQPINVTVTYIILLKILPCIYMSSHAV